MNHLLLGAEDSEAELQRELLRAFPGVRLAPVKPLLFEAEFTPPPDRPFPHLPHARQFFPRAIRVQAESIRLWAEAILQQLDTGLPQDQPWILHIEPHYGARQVHRMGARAWHTQSRSKHPVVRTQSTFDPAAGRHRCELVREALIEQLRRKRRHTLKVLLTTPRPFTPADSLVQVCLTSPTEGYISVAPAPEPFNLRHVLSFLPMGRVEIASDKAAPSRAFAKLVEAEIRLGQRLERGQTCVDLGAAPGSWTYVAVARGATVFAVDRAPLREDLMASAAVRSVCDDAFRYTPEAPVDWLLCDVIAEPDLTANLLLKWLRNSWCRRFIVTLKLKDSPQSLEAMERFVAEASALTEDLRVTRLCANKKEVCAYGVTSKTRATSSRR